MAERKFGGKFTAINGSASDPFQKTRKHRRSDSSTLATMNNGKTIVNDTANSDYQELIALIKQWLTHSRNLYPNIPRLGIDTAQREFSVACFREPKRDSGVKAEDEVMLALEAAGAGTFRWDMRTDTITWDGVLERLFGVQSPNTVRSLDQLLALVHPEDRREILESMRALPLEWGRFRDGVPRGLARRQGGMVLW